MSTVNFSANKVWEFFIQTFTGEPELKVSKIDNNYITFKLSPTKAANLFKDSEVVKANVIHAYSSTNKAIPYLHLTGAQTISGIIDNNFLKELKLNFESKACIDNIQTKVMTCKVEANSVFQLTKSIESYKNLQTLLKSEEQVSSIMLGSSKILREEDFTGENSLYGEEIIKITSNFEVKRAEVSIDYNKIIMATEIARTKKPDLTKVEEAQEEYILSKDKILSYAQEIIPSGIIYSKLPDGKLQPILFQSVKADKPNVFQSSVFDFIVDVSGSMSNDLPKIKVKLMELITKIITDTKQWTVKIIPFSDNIEPTGIFTSDSNDINSITKFVYSLKTLDGTALYSAMQNVYSNEIAHTSSTVNNVIFTITDGENNGGQYNSNDVIKLAQTLRTVSPQSTMYNIGYASYSKAFFDNLSQNTAAKTVHLDNPNDLENLYSEAKTMNNCKVLYEFSSNQYAQCAAGDIFIPSFTTDSYTQVKIAGETYGIGIEVN